MHHHLKTKIIWFGVGKCYQDHWKKIPILVYIILGPMPSNGGQPQLDFPSGLNNTSRNLLT